MFSSKPSIAIKVLTKLSGKAIFSKYLTKFLGPGLRAGTKPRPSQALIIIEAVVRNVITRVTTAVKGLAFLNHDREEEIIWRKFNIILAATI